MKAISLHRQVKQVALVPTCMSAYWSNQFSNGSLGNDRTPEITVGFREGAGYA